MGDCEICRIFADMKIQYYIVLALWYVFSLLPLKVHYVFSDLIFWLLYKVVGYRKKVVRTNLTTSFPEKSEEESLDDLLKIIREYNNSKNSIFVGNDFEEYK